MKLYILLSCTMFWAMGCGGGPVSAYPGDPVAAVQTECEAHLQSGMTCDGDCIVARLNLTCPESEDLFGTDEMGAYLDCMTACPSVLECENTTRTLRDCDCVAECAAAAAVPVLDSLAFAADCLLELEACQ